MDAACTATSTRLRPASSPGPSTLDQHVEVALGRRVEVIGDLLLPIEPSASSLAVSHDIARRLEEWQGPGILIVCGRIFASGCPEGSARRAFENHAQLAGALEAFAARSDSRVIVVMPSLGPRP